LYLAGSIVGGIGLGWIAVHPPRNPISEREEKNVELTAHHDSDYFVDLALPASDGTVLKAWFIRPSSYNGNVVLLLHGVSDNRLGMYGYGKWLLTKGYAVLLPDARGHGLSGGLASYGLKESDDIHRLVD